MSRFRRLVLSDHWFFITCRVLPWRGVLCDSEFTCLARVIDARCRSHGFLLSAWVFQPNRWHALFYPPYPLTISTVMESIKVGATRRINRPRGESGVLFQGRYFDRAVRTAKEYHDKVEYIHLNPRKAGLTSRPDHWPWSSVHDYTGMVDDAPATPSGLPVDRVLLPTDPQTLI